MTAAQSLLGLSETGFVMVLVALIGLASAVTVAIIQSRRTQATAEETRDTLGAPEDDLTVVEMLRAILAGQTGQDARLAKHDARLASHDRRLDGHDRILDEHGAILRQLRGEEN